jgi:hypothetical protein
LSDLGQGKTLVGIIPRAVFHIFRGTVIEESRNATGGVRIHKPIPSRSVSLLVHEREDPNNYKQYTHVPQSCAVSCIHFILYDFFYFI